MRRNHHILTRSCIFGNDDGIPIYSIIEIASGIGCRIVIPDGLDRDVGGQTQVLYGHGVVSGHLNEGRSQSEFLHIEGTAVIQHGGHYHVVGSHGLTRQQAYAIVVGIDVLNIPLGVAFSARGVGGLLRLVAGVLAPVVSQSIRIVILVGILTLGADVLNVALLGTSGFYHGDPVGVGEYVQCHSLNCLTG